ncbi:MAG: site-2 protease family protein [Nanoarchaeota archaeon]|nr:site-2 protease family protein [Nanoarchaeota archaeon]
MASFFIYDISFLIIFCIFIAIFLYSRKKNLKKEGIIFLYKTQIGVKAINYVGEKFSKTLKSLRYVVIATGFVLMITMVYLIFKSFYIYLTMPGITDIIKAPPIAPLIPYFPEVFGMKSLFPPFYFTYFLIALMIVALVHEFSHGIFMKLSKVRIKSTGFVFLGPILGAFVEQDDKQMVKKPKFEQMSILGAGVFANTVCALVFYGFLVLFFYSSFAPSGYIYDMYAMSPIPSNQITGFGNLSSNLTEVYTLNQTYYIDSYLKTQLRENSSYLIVYDDSPALKADLKGIIINADNEKIRNQKDLESFLAKKKPGDKIILTTLIEINNIKTEKEYLVTLGKHPLNESKAYLGIASLQKSGNGFIGKFLGFFMQFKDSSTYYTVTWDGGMVIFIYDLIWWIMLINFLVALFNMLPLSILDGGRFFYLSMLSISKSEEFAKKSFKFISIVLWSIFALMMIFWFFKVI